jgi:hypothetical protein
VRRIVAEPDIDKIEYRRAGPSRAGPGCGLLKKLFQLERDCGILHLTEWGTSCVRLYRIVPSLAQGGTGEQELPGVANMVFWASHIYLSFQGGHAVGF